MARVTLISQKRMNQTISHLPGVIGAVRAEAVQIGARAEARLKAHFYEGEAEISVTHGAIDSFVNLDDPAALSIEFGHTLYVHGQKTGRQIPGLYIISGASGLI